MGWKRYFVRSTQMPALGGCPRIMDGQNLTSQNAPESTIGNLGGVLLPPKMPIFAFLGQAPRGTIRSMRYTPLRSVGQDCAWLQRVLHLRFLCNGLVCSLLSPAHASVFSY